jgi:hypothetical protein
MRLLAVYAGAHNWYAAAENSAPMIWKDFPFPYPHWISASNTTRVIVVFTANCFYDRGLIGKCFYEDPAL